MNDKAKDITVIGAGPAGLTAAIYAARSGMNTLVIEKAMAGGQLWLSEKIENYPGFPGGVNSFKLAGDMEKQARNFGAEIIKEKVSSIQKKDGILLINCKSSKEISSSAVIICSGVRMKKLKVPGERKFSGKGVSYCAVCDGPLFKEKTVAVVGGGNTACEEAEYLTRFASKVVLIHRRRRLRAVKNIAKRVRENPGIQLVLEDEIQKIEGKERVEGVFLKSGKKIKVDGVFIFIGYTASTEWLGEFIKTVNGFIKTDRDLKTSRQGIYSAGDCRQGALRQVVSACGEGAQAAESARKYVEKMKGIAYDW